MENFEDPGVGNLMHDNKYTEPDIRKLIEDSRDKLKTAINEGDADPEKLQKYNELMDQYKNPKSQVREVKEIEKELVELLKPYDGLIATFAYRYK